jgi:hypothetical protein
MSLLGNFFIRGIATPSMGIILIQLRQQAGLGWIYV